MQENFTSGKDAVTIEVLFTIQNAKCSSPEFKLPFLYCIVLRLCFVENTELQNEFISTAAVLEKLRSVQSQLMTMKTGMQFEWPKGGSGVA